MAIVHVNDSEFDQQIVESKQLVLADFWAPWCSPCQAMTHVLEDLANEFSEKLKICKINVDENQESASKYQVLSLPTILFFKNGEITSQLIGPRPASDIKKAISSLL